MKKIPKEHSNTLQQLNNIVAELDDVSLQCDIETSFFKLSTFKFNYKCNKGSWKNVSK